MRLRFLIFVGLAVFGTGSVSAAVVDFEDLDRLEMQLAAFLGRDAHGIDKSVAPIDRRLRLKRCTESVVFDEGEAGAIVVRCDSAGWRIRVRLLSSSQRDTEIVVRRGDVLQLTNSGTGFHVTSAVVATEDGRQGGMVRVKTLTGNTTLTVRVQDSGAVTMGN